MATHQVFGHSQGVVNRALGVPERLFHVAVQLTTRQTHDVLLGTGGLRHLRSNGCFVVARIIESDRERLDGTLTHRRSKTEDRTTVDSA